MSLGSKVIKRQSPCGIKAISVVVGMWRQLMILILSNNHLGLHVIQFQGILSFQRMQYK
jgi:hypothetical protein